MSDDTGDKIDISTIPLMELVMDLSDTLRDIAHFEMLARHGIKPDYGSVEEALDITRRTKDVIVDELCRRKKEGLA